MTRQEQLEMNIAAANVLGYLHIDWDADRNLDKTCVVSMDDDRWDTFSIFTNAEQCLEVVKKLLWHGFTITPYVEASELHSVTLLVECDSPIVETKDTLEQAVGAACIELVRHKESNNEK